MKNETERVKWFRDNMRVTAPDDDGVRYLTREGLKDGRRPLARAEGEHVEHWATSEIFWMIDWDEQDREPL